MNEPQRVHAKLDQSNYWWGRGGAISHTISGIDIAMWDILGKVTGQSIGRSLGGVYRDKVKPFASLGFGNEGDIGKLVETIKASMARGFRALKLGWGTFYRTGNLEDDEKLVSTGRRGGFQNAPEEL